MRETQHDQAQATVEFLANKFTNAELYEWMSGILGGAYSYFLQQATAMAQLAQHQLAFERQETPPAFIKADYWEAPGDTATPGGGNGTEPDRRGLTGSVRLLQDITRLDQFAFETNKRKLQLAQTFSLAQLFPAEFQRFRETGSLPFATPMALFDQGFPWPLPAPDQTRARLGHRPDTADAWHPRHPHRLRPLARGQRWRCVPDHRGAARPRADRLHLAQ